MNKTTTALCMVIASIGLAGCASQGETKASLSRSGEYFFDLVPTKNPAGAPNVFHDGAKTYFLPPLGDAVRAVSDCGGKEKVSIPVGRSAPYWIANRVSSCWAVETNSGVYRFRRNGIGVGPDHKTKNTPTASVADKAAPECASLASLAGEIRKAKAKVRKLAMLVSELQPGSCQGSSPVARDEVLAVPFVTNHLELDPIGMEVVRGIALRAKGARQIILTGRAGSYKGRPPNEWIARTRAKAVKEALVKAGVSKDIIKIVKLDPPPKGVWVKVEIKYGK